MADKTTHPIRDLQDNKYYYRTGETYPREGLEVSDERLTELREGGHIVSDEVVESDLTKLKKDELLALANEQGVDVSDSDTKAEIIEKLGE